MLVASIPPLLNLINQSSAARYRYHIRKTPAACQQLLSLATYNSHEVSNGYKNRRINVSDRRTFHINRRDFFKTELKNFVTCHIPYLGLGLTISVMQTDL
jgi:hypothetical protein